MSKRNLYKPAPSQTPPRVGRKSLIQGRLIQTDPHSLLNNVSPSRHSAPKPSPQTERTLTPRVRRSLDYHSALSATKSEPHSPHHQISPTIVTSPARVKPSSSLSLSETEDEPRKKLVETNEPTLNPPVNSVLTVDATQRHSSFKDNEVPIKTSYINSPVKVVCHSPQRQTTRAVTDTAGSGVQYAHAGKIKVPIEAVPTVNVVHGASIFKINESQSSSSPPASEDGSLNTIAGSPVDPRSKAVETRVVREKDNPRSYISFLDDDCPSVIGSDVMFDASDQSEIHIAQPRFDDTAISSIAGDSTLSSIGEDAKRKRKKTRVVQSKYMTSAMSRRGQKSSTTKSKRADLGPKIKVNPKSKKSETKGAAKSLPKAHEKTFESGRKKDGAKVHLFTSTPAVSAHRVISNTSNVVTGITPAPDRSAPTEDVSLLKPSFFASNKDQTQKKKTNLKDVSHSKDVKREPSAQARQSKRQTLTGDISQLQLDLQYARLCQWRFLRSKARHTFEKQEKDAQEQMYSIWQLNDQLRKKNHELKIQLETKQKREEIDRQLELQLPLLRSLDGISSRLFADYYGLFEGIDTTRHHVTVKEILLPENEGDLLEALDSCENTLGEITTLLQDDQTKVLSFSKDMQILADTVQEERKQHDGCTELLAAASTLTTQEKSLQAEIVQRKET